MRNWPLSHRVSGRGRSSFNRSDVDVVRTDTGNGEERTGRHGGSEAETMKAAPSSCSITISDALVQYRFSISASFATRRRNSSLVLNSASR